jgi:hypothetical protein
MPGSRQPMKTISMLVALLCLGFSSLAVADEPDGSAAEPAPVPFSELADAYHTQTRPLLEQFCVGCHSTAKQEGNSSQLWPTYGEGRKRG